MSENILSQTLVIYKCVKLCRYIKLEESKELTDHNTDLIYDNIRETIKILVYLV